MAIASVKYAAAYAAVVTLKGVTALSGLVALSATWSWWRGIPEERSSRNLSATQIGARPGVVFVGSLLVACAAHRAATCILAKINTNR